jgi:TonB family protein
MFALLESSSSVQLAHHRSPYIRIMLLALLAHLILFVLTPPFTFKPYQMEDKIVITVVPPIDDIIPPPPEENPMPVNTVAALDNDADDDVEIPPTMYKDVEAFPTSVPCLDKRPPADFYAFDDPPDLIHFERPVYPEFSRESGIEGTVEVKVVVDRSGKVTDAVVLSSDVTTEMEQAALKAARGCLFKPGSQRGKPVTVAVMIPFEFRLSDCK